MIDQKIPKDYRNTRRGLKRRTQKATPVMRPEQLVPETVDCPTVRMGRRQDGRRANRVRRANPCNAQAGANKQIGKVIGQYKLIPHKWVVRGDDVRTVLQRYTSVHMRVVGNILVMSLSGFHCVFCGGLALEKKFVCGRCKF